MIPEKADSPQTFYLVGTVVLLIGVLAVAAGSLIKSRAEERDRDERYVRERRGEEIAPVPAPPIVDLLRSVGLGIAAVGILILVAGWTLAPGQN